MVIKKFLGKTESEAVEAAKKELGDGIVIMNVKEVKKKGLFGFFQKKQVEVTVALEEEREQEKQIKKDIRDAVQSVKSIAGITGETDKNSYNTGSPGRIQGDGTENIEKKLDSLQTLLQNQLNIGQAVTDNLKSVLESSDKEEAAPKEEDKPAQSDAEGRNEEQESFFKLLYNTMIENEVDEKFANQIIEDAGKNSKPNIPFDYILAGIYQKMVLKFGKSSGIVPAKSGPKTVFFIGPTGVGKTTTIAKIASRFAMEEKKKVALITTDTYRIAAAEQLHTYANILEVPFRVIYTADELAGAVKDFEGYDYIFVDTAGHSPQNEEHMEKLKEFIDAAKGVSEYQVFLVLSATTKYKDLLNIAERYGGITKYQLIFTKIDETSTLGNLINVKLHMDTPIAYVTYGQNVPEDIESFNPQKTVKQILGGKYDK
jgi:flagellar biosynthesis protein FlhF